MWMMMIVARNASVNGLCRCLGCFYSTRYSSLHVYAYPKFLLIPFPSSQESGLQDHILWLAQTT